MHKIILDTDPGIDDALAILLLATSSEIELKAITVTHGNTTVDKCLANAIQIADLAGIRNIPIAKGANQPLIGKLQIAEETHGDTGLGYAKLPPSNYPIHSNNASQLIVELVKKYPGEITILGIGPVTNIALALISNPEIKPLIKDVVLMAGSFEYAGNASPVAEYNVFCDPYALQVLINANLDLTIIPLDVTYQCLFTKEHLAELQNCKKDIYEFISDSTRFYMEFHQEYQNITGCAINDPLVVAYLLNRELLELMECYVEVNLHKGNFYGKTSADRFSTLGLAPNAKVATQVDVPAFMKLFIDRMHKL